MHFLEWKYINLDKDFTAICSHWGRRNGHHFTNDIFKCIFLNENISISIKISLQFVPKFPINNIPVLVQIMAWRRSGDKLLSKPMMVSLPTHIWVTRPQWVKRTCCCQSLPHVIYIFCSCCTNVTLCYHPVLMEIILVVIMVMFQSLLVYIYPCCPTYYSSYIYIIICDQVTVVTRQSKVATGLAEKNSLTANTNSSHCHDIYIYIYTVVIFFAIYSKPHRNHIIHQ